MINQDLRSVDDIIDTELSDAKNWEMELPGQIEVVAQLETMTRTSPEAVLLLLPDTFAFLGRTPADETLSKIMNAAQMRSTLQLREHLYQRSAGIGEYLRDVHPVVAQNSDNVAATAA